jgi:hypothetical protein
VNKIRLIKSSLIIEHEDHAARDKDATCTIFGLNKSTITRETRIILLFLLLAHRRPAGKIDSPFHALGRAIKADIAVEDSTISFLSFLLITYFHIGAKGH